MRVHLQFPDQNWVRIDFDARIHLQFPDQNWVRIDFDVRIHLQFPDQKDSFCWPINEFYPLYSGASQSTFQNLKVPESGICVYLSKIFKHIDDEHFLKMIQNIFWKIQNFQNWNFANRNCFWVTYKFQKTVFDIIISNLKFWKQIVKRLLSNKIFCQTFFVW